MLIQVCVCPLHFHLHTHTNIQCRRQVGGNKGTFPRALSVWGHQNSHELIQIRCGSSFKFRSSLSKGFISLYSWFQVSMLSCFAFMLLAQTLLMHILSLSDHCISLLARIQCIKFFYPTANRRWQLAGMCMHKDESQEHPGHTLKNWGGGGGEGRSP